MIGGPSPDRSNAMVVPSFDCVMLMGFLLERCGVPWTPACGALWRANNRLSVLGRTVLGWRAHGSIVRSAPTSVPNCLTRSRPKAEVGRRGATAAGVCTNGGLGNKLRQGLFE